MDQLCWPPDSKVTTLGGGALDIHAFSLLAGLVPADRVAEMFLAYCRVVEAQARVAELQMGSEAGRSSASGSCPGLPGSEVSVNSSASSARARRRARWKLNKAARVAASSQGSSVVGVSEVGSHATYAGASAPASGTEKSSGRDGYCYLDVLEPAVRSQAKAELGPSPSFSRLLSMPEGWFLKDLTRLSVRRVGPGVFHVGLTGFTASLCLKAVVVKAAGDGHKFVKGSMACAVASGTDRVFHVDKAPDWSDVLGTSEGSLGSRVVVGDGASDSEDGQFCGVEGHDLRALALAKGWPLDSLLRVVRKALVRQSMGASDMLLYVRSLMAAVTMQGDVVIANFPGCTARDVDCVFRAVVKAGSNGV